MDQLRARRLTSGSVLKLVLLGLLWGFLPLMLFAGVLVALGLGSMTWNGQAVTGIWAVVAGPALGLLMALLCTGLVGGVMALGLWLYSQVRPLTLDYYSLREE